MLGYVFNPLELYWCHDETASCATSSPKCRTHTAAARIPASARLTISPRGCQEDVLCLTVQRSRRLLPDPRTAACRTRTRCDGSRYSGKTSPRLSRRCAVHVGRRPTPAPRAATGSPGGAADGRAGNRFHGIWLWLRRVPVVPAVNTKASLNHCDRSSSPNRSRRYRPRAAGRASHGFPAADVAGSRASGVLICCSGPRLAAAAAGLSGRLGGRCRDPALPTLFVHQPDSLARRVGRSGLIGFGESYMAGEWDVAPTWSVF